MTPFQGCIETAEPVRNSGNGMWRLQKYHDSEMQAPSCLMQFLKKLEHCWISPKSWHMQGKPQWGHNIDPFH